MDDSTLLAFAICVWTHFGVEFADGAGRPIHQFTAMPSSNLDMFFGWVRLHQRCSEDRGCNARPAFEENGSSIGQTTTNQAKCAGALLAILSACCQRGLRVRATVQNSAIVQRAHFSPQCCTLKGTGGLLLMNRWDCTFVPPNSRMPKLRRNPTRVGRDCSFTAKMTPAGRR
jgi:hypothetical protein